MAESLVCDPKVASKGSWFVAHKGKNGILTVVMAFQSQDDAGLDAVARNDRAKEFGIDCQYVVVKGH